MRGLCRLLRLLRRLRAAPGVAGNDDQQGQQHKGGEAGHAQQEQRRVEYGVAHTDGIFVHMDTDLTPVCVPVAKLVCSDFDR